MDGKAYQRHLQAMIDGIDRSRAQKRAFAASLKKSVGKPKGRASAAAREPLWGTPAGAKDRRPRVP